MIAQATETKAGDPRAMNPLHRLTPEQIEAIGREFQQLHDEIVAELGD